MACETTLPVQNHTPEEVTEITQRYYTKGILFRRGKIARQMREVREQCPTARAMDDGHRQRETTALISGVFGGLVWMGLALYYQNRAQASRGAFLEGFLDGVKDTVNQPTPWWKEPNDDRLNDVPEVG